MMDRPYVDSVATGIACGNFRVLFYALSLISYTADLRGSIEVLYPLDDTFGIASASISH